MDQVNDVYRTALSRYASRRGGRGCARPEWTTSALLEELFQTSTRPLSTGFFLPRRRVEAPPAGFAARPVAARPIEPLRGGWKVQVRSVWRANREAAVLLPRPAPSGAVPRCVWP
ncbi:MAG: hypothetical protein V8Q84_12810 [Bilophila sp.]